MRPLLRALLIVGTAIAAQEVVSSLDLFKRAPTRCVEWSEPYAMSAWSDPACDSAACFRVRSTLSECIREEPR